MPEVTDNGKTYTVHVRKGIYFTPDPAFKGSKRELVAADYAYSLKRLIDPAHAARRGRGSSRARFVGLDAAAEAAKKTGKFDYDAQDRRASRRPTATRCGSGSRRPTTTCRTCSRTSRRRRSRAR